MIIIIIIIIITTSTLPLKIWFTLNVTIPTSCVNSIVLLPL